MADIKSKKDRSINMSKIQSRNTKPELFVRSILHRMGYRFRLNRKDIFGHPDIVLPKWRIAIFVHGCFWHGHQNCPKSKLPSTNTEFWASKISGNIERDRLVKDTLIGLGWRVLVIWQCSMKNKEKQVELSSKIKKWVDGDEVFGEIA
ncbi:DNA mismatch endonuclease Vsr [uncultured Parasutterella sp.]|mgnify:FL=1|uniref:very short patch repair endonuclease n=1 Tax=uncultured Parasutterella sp. TaxID=1263098 RepID=UPI0025953152|nr:DNA mismatch endonuclease Vsr [uncultured Parasutterella sp.]